VPDQAEIVLDGALRASEAASIALHIPLIRAMRAFCQAHAGRLAEGLPVLE